MQLKIIAEFQYTHITLIYNITNHIIIVLFFCFNFIKLMHIRTASRMSWFLYYFFLFFSTQI
jgi:hypothetical protein